MAEQKEHDVSALLPGVQLNDDGSTSSKKNRASYHAGANMNTSDSQQNAAYGNANHSASGTGASTVRHSHSRSRSVNLSPTLQAGPSFSPGAIKWDPFGNDNSRPATSIALPLLQGNRLHAVAGPSSNLSSSPLLRPTSPIYVNVKGLAVPPTTDAGVRSPMYAGSEGGSSSGGSDAGTSPDARRTSQIIARAMEKQNSGGPVGFRPRSPRSPRDSVRRTASPSRAYAVPLSPRLQAFGASVGHGRRRSSGSGVMIDPIARLPSPSMLEGSPLRPTSPGQRISPSSPSSDHADLPVDSVWPTSKPESGLPIDANGVQSIPLAGNNTRSTPIPPSLREELAAHGTSGVTVIPISGPSSPVQRTHSPLVEWSTTGHKMRRTPSPNVWQGAGARGSSQSPTMSTVPLPSTSPTTPSQLSSSPRLAAPQPVNRNAQTLTSLAMRRHSRALSNASSDSDEGSTATTKEQTKLSAVEGSPTHKGISPSRASQVEVSDDVAIVDLSATSSADQEGAKSDSPKMVPQAVPSPSQRHMLLQRRPSTEHVWRASPGASQAFGAEAAFSSHAPPFRSTSPAAATLGESPPKSRSFIGMPPRSGYELSDDPDDVGSEDGSVGSGRDSVGTNEDREDDEEESADEDIENAEATDDDQRYLASSHAVEQKTEKPQRPSLRPGAVVTPAPLEEGADAWRDDLAMEEEGIDQAGEDREHDVQDEDEDEAPADEAPLMEESLTTLERIFLFAKSEMTYHRVLVSHSLADWVMEVELSEAVEFVIPLLNGLACDASEVCVTFAPQLHRVMWYFFRNCPLNSVDEPSQEAHTGQKEDEGEEERATRPRLSVSIFTPLLCALLLNSNAAIADAAQTAIVYFFARLQGLTLAGDTFEPSEDDTDGQNPDPGNVESRALQRRPFDQDTMLVNDAAAREEKRVPLEAYAFGPAARQKIVEEFLGNVAMAIGHLLKDGGGDQMDDHAESTPMPHQSEFQVDPAQQQTEADGLHNDDDDEVQKVREAAQADLHDLESGNSHRAEDLEMGQDMLEEGSSWAQGNQEDESGDTAMVSVDGASMTISIEEEAAVGRMASISLLCALATEALLSSDFLLAAVVPELLLLAEDRTFFVRKEAAVAFGSLARLIGTVEIEKHGILELFTNLCNDQIWHVRQAACLSTPNMLSQIPDRALRRSKVLELMDVFVNDVSRNVRVAALDIIGEVIYLFHQDQDGVPAKLLRHFLGLPWEEQENAAEEETHRMHEGYQTHQDGMHQIDGNSMHWDSAGSGIDYPFHAATTSEPDRPLVMAYNIPAVALTLGAEKWSILRTHHTELCNHMSPKVRRSLAASLHEIAKIIGKQAATADLAQCVAHFIDHKFEQDGDVKMALLEHIDEFLVHIDTDKALAALQLLQELWNDSDRFGMGVRFHNSWRLRQKLISKLPKLAQTFLLQDDQGILVLLMQSSLLDPVSAVRAEGVKAVTPLYHQFAEHDQVLADGFLGMLVDLCETRSGYRARVATLQALSELCKSPIQRASIELLVMPRLVELSKDDIPDIRLSLADLMSQICQVDRLYALTTSRTQSLIGILRRLAHDNVVSIREKIASLMTEEDLQKLGPASPQPERNRRELILGPADGGQHHPPSVMDEESSNNDHVQADDAALFAMDDEEDAETTMDADNGDLADGGEQPLRRPAPSLVNSTLARRRFFNGPTHKQPLGQTDGTFGSSFAPADYSSRRHNQQLDPFADHYGEEGGTITLPEEDIEQVASYAVESNQHTFEYNSSAAEEDYTHHLLGVADNVNGVEGGAPQGLVPFNFDDDSILLESPERPLVLSQGDSAGQAPSSPAMNKGKNASRDPFLAFVAHQHFDRAGEGKLRKEEEQRVAMASDPYDHRSTPDAPLSPVQQRSTFEDDDEDEEHFRGE